MNAARQTLILEYVKTAAIVFGIFFGLMELRNVNRDREINKFENTATMIKGFGEPDVVAGATALLLAVQSPTGTEKWSQLLASLTPYRQHLITWSACVEFENCDKNGSMAYLCRSLMTYESALELVFAKNSKEFNAERRDQSYFGRHSKCQNEFPEELKTIRSGLVATLKGAAN